MIKPSSCFGIVIGTGLLDENIKHDWRPRYTLVTEVITEKRDGVTLFQFDLEIFTPVVWLLPAANDYSHWGTTMCHLPFAGGWGWHGSKCMCSSWTKAGSQNISLELHSSSSSKPQGIMRNKAVCIMESLLRKEHCSLIQFIVLHSSVSKDYLSYILLGDITEW